MEAVNAEAAFAVLAACSEEVQVLFTDGNLPGSMDGMMQVSRG